MGIAHFVHESSNLQYQGYTTTGMMTPTNMTDAGSGIMRHLEDFPIILFENLSTYNSP